MENQRNTKTCKFYDLQVFVFFASKKSYMKELSSFIIKPGVICSVRIFFS
jgi:hypothetical protein